MSQEQTAAPALFIAQYDCADHAHTRRCQTPEEAVEWIMVNDGWGIEEKVVAPRGSAADALANAFCATMAVKLYWRNRAASQARKGLRSNQQSSTRNFPFDA